MCSLMNLGIGLALLEMQVQTTPHFQGCVVFGFVYVLFCCANASQSHFQTL